MKQEKQQQEFERYINEQFRILKGHCERCFLRCWNKFVNLKIVDEAIKLKLKENGIHNKI